MIVQAALRVDRAANRFDDAAQFDAKFIIHRLNDMTEMFLNGRLNETTAPLIQRSHCPSFINLHESSIADHVCSEDRRQSA